jgi:hypothetical protein
MADDPKVLEQVLSEYRHYFSSVLLPTYHEAKALFKGWKHPDYWAKSAQPTRLPNPSPVQRISARIKRPESVVDKIKRKPTDYPEGLSTPSFEKRTDAVGLRAMVYFIGNLTLVDSELRRMKAVEISSVHPPIAYLGQEIAERYGL